MRRKRDVRQRTLVFRTRGGKRKKAGRKLAPGKRRSVSHHGRAPHKGAHPAHVTLRLREGIPSLRERGLYLAVEEAIRAGNDRFGFRVNEFSVQGNHLHLVVEAEDALAIRRGMQGLTIRVARAFNRALSRTGKVFADRFHHRDLKTPTEVRNVLVYVLLNEKHHAKGSGKSWPIRRVDPCSSATWFTGWTEAIESLRLKGPSPVVPPRTWLLRTGWRRLGLLRPWEAPRGHRPDARRRRAASRTQRS